MRGVLSPRRFRKEFLARFEGAAAQIETVEVEEVECKVHEPIASAGVEIRLQHTKVGDAVFSQHDCFTIDDGGIGWEVFERSGDRREAIGPVVPAT